MGQQVKEVIAARDRPPPSPAPWVLGPNELLAKIAAEMEKPDGLVALHPDILPGPLLGLCRLSDMPGIARGNAARLARAGVGGHVGSPGDSSPRNCAACGEASRASGSGWGCTAMRWNGPETQRRMFGHGRVLPADWRHLSGSLCVPPGCFWRKPPAGCAGPGSRPARLALWLTDRHSAGWYGEERFTPTWDDPFPLGGP